ncbi:HAMP domain-containing protein [Trichothermofontia sp.]
MPIRMNTAIQTLWVRLSKPGIARKIAYGYGVAIGVAILGTSLGLVVGDYYHRQAQRQLVIARQQQIILSKLDKEIVEIRSHPQRLMMTFGDTIWFDFERTAFLSHVDDLQAALLALNTFVAEHPNDLATTAQELQAISQRYEINVQAYLQWVQSFWEHVDPPRLTPASVPAAQQALLVAMRQQPMIGIEVELERLAEQLERVLNAAQNQQVVANTQLESAESLRVRIILASMVIAVLIAATLAVYTSRAIAQPIEAVTQVAEQVSRDANFHLQAPVLTQDEVGVLAMAFNSLIQKVAFYTQALEVNQQTQKC